MRAYTFLAFLLIGAHAASINDVKKIEAQKPCADKNESKEPELVKEEEFVTNNNNNELRVQQIGKEIHIPVQIITGPEPLPQISNEKSDSSNEIVPEEEIKKEDPKPETPENIPVKENETPVEVSSTIPPPTITQGLIQSVQKLQASFQQGLQSIGQSIYSYFFKNSLNGNESPNASTIQESIVTVQKDFETNAKLIKEKLQSYITANNKNTDVAYVQSLKQGLDVIQEGVENNLKAISQNLNALIMGKSDLRADEATTSSNIPFVPEFIQSSIQNNIQGNIPFIQSNTTNLQFPEIPGQGNLPNIPNLPGQGNESPLTQIQGQLPGQGQIPGLSNAGNIQNPLGGTNQIINQQNQQNQQVQFPWTQWFGGNQEGSSTSSPNEQAPWQSFWNGIWQNSENNITNWNENFQNWWQNNGGQRPPNSQSDEQPQRPGIVGAFQQFAQNIFGNTPPAGVQADDDGSRPPGIIQQGIQNLQNLFNRPGQTQQQQQASPQPQSITAQEGSNSVPTAQPLVQRNPIVQGIQNVVQRVQSAVRPNDEPRKKGHGDGNRDNNHSSGKVSDEKDQSADGKPDAEVKSPLAVDKPDAEIKTQAIDKPDVEVKSQTIDKQQLEVNSQPAVETSESEVPKPEVVKNQDGQPVEEKKPEI